MTIEIVLAALAVLGWLAAGYVGYLYLRQERTLMYDYAERTENWLCDTSRIIEGMRSDCDERENKMMDRIMAPSLLRYVQARTEDKKIEHDFQREMGELDVKMADARGREVPVPETQWEQVGAGTGL